ncbi:hypothetical protein N656DRAFT_216507 [Canariomyces notabilis]|uniref:Uncharacterized protein n=1 Tax=Canariomyces notabilis TaxID=2074819 RepID=A0AAN6TKB2_9PEZI|nr:hypothetical protein N656DRAFT_216507 [Canariomyces arenarius]
MYHLSRSVHVRRRVRRKAVIAQSTLGVAIGWLMPILRHTKEDDCIFAISCATCLSRNHIAGCRFCFDNNTNSSLLYAQALHWCLQTQQPWRYASTI